MFSTRRFLLERAAWARQEGLAVTQEDMVVECCRCPETLRILIELMKYVCFSAVFLFLLTCTVYSRNFQAVACSPDITCSRHDSCLWTRSCRPCLINLFARISQSIRIVRSSGSDCIDLQGISAFKVFLPVSWRSLKEKWESPARRGKLEGNDGNRKPLEYFRLHSCWKSLFTSCRSRIDARTSLDCIME